MNIEIWCGEEGCICFFPRYGYHVADFRRASIPQGRKTQVLVVVDIGQNPYDSGQEEVSKKVIHQPEVTGLSLVPRPLMTSQDLK